MIPKVNSQKEAHIVTLILDLVYIILPVFVFF